MPPPGFLSFDPGYSYCLWGYYVDAGDGVGTGVADPSELAFVQNKLRKNTMNTKYHKRKWGKK